jgi:hypothetical protein
MADQRVDQLSANLNPAATLLLYAEDPTGLLDYKVAIADLIKNVTAGGDLTGTFGTPTLATSGVTAGTYGSATQTSHVQFDAKGRAVSASNTTIQIPESQVTNLTSDLSAKAADNTVVHNTTNENVGGIKTFTSAPVFPAGSIGYSELALTGAILNADLAGSIAYSKLNLTGAILNADLAGSIAESKITNLTTDLAAKAPKLTPTALKATGDSPVTANAGDLVKLDSSGGTITVNLAAAPADGSRIGILLVTAGNSVTVNLGGSDVWNVAGVTTPKTLATAGQYLEIQYQTTGAIWLVKQDVLLSLNDGTGTTVDTSLPGIAKVGVNVDQTLQSIQFGNTNSPIVVMSARLATDNALPACTYANGSSGVGATLTATGNAALGSISRVTTVLGDRILVRNQASGFQNGVYDITQLGDGSHPFILTRSTQCDQAAEYAHGVWVFISEGTFSGAVIVCPANSSVTMGTTVLNFTGHQRMNVTPADVSGGPQRNERRLEEEFNFTTTASTTGKRLTESKETGVFMSGAASQVAQIDPFGTNAESTTPGCAECATGTATTGACGVQLSATNFTWDATRRARFGSRIKVPTLSSGAQTFIVRSGFIQGNGLAAPTAGIYWELPADGTSNWKIVCNHASTPTSSDSGVAQATLFRDLIVTYDEVAAAAHFYTNDASGSPIEVSNSPIITNLPTTDTLTPLTHIIKSAGTLTRTVEVDYMECVFKEARTQLTLMP